MSMYDVRWVDLTGTRWTDTIHVKWIPRVDVQILGRIKMYLEGRDVATVAFSNPRITKMTMDSLIPVSMSFEVPVLTRMDMIGKKPKINFSSDT